MMGGSSELYVQIHGKDTTPSGLHTALLFPCICVNYHKVIKCLIFSTMGLLGILCIIRIYSSNQCSKDTLEEASNKVMKTSIS